MATQDNADTAPSDLTGLSPGGLSAKNSPVIEDQRFEIPAIEAKYVSTVFRRVSGTKIHFIGASFKYCRFDDCYFRNCKFEDCDFTGAVFSGCNLRGSTFEGSTFDYARFNSTIVTEDLLDRNAPRNENIALLFARTLRTNFGQIGDSEAVNHAIRVELQATRDHLRKAAFSRETYYRRKYVGLDRVSIGLKYTTFRTLDLVWGNGESIWRLALTILIVNTGIFLSLSLDNIPEALQLTPAVFVGAPVAPEISRTITVVAAFLRYLLLGAFTATVVRRLSRR